MPTKTKKTPKTATSRTGVSSLNKGLKKKLNWKIATLIILLFAGGLGYLFVRLSQAATEANCGGPAYNANCAYYPVRFNRDAGVIETKTNGVVAWHGTPASSVPTATPSFNLTDSVYGGNYAIRYCVEVVFIRGSNWKITATNLTVGNQAGYKSGTADPLTYNKTQQVCTDGFAPGGTAGVATPLKITFESTGEVYAYKVVRIVTASGPSSDLPAAPKPATNPGAKGGVVNPNPAVPVTNKANKNQNIPK